VKKKTEVTLRQLLVILQAPGFGDLLDVATGVAVSHDYKQLYTGVLTPESKDLCTYWLTSHSGASLVQKRWDDMGRPEALIQKPRRRVRTSQSAVKSAA
jgi:hypothetical protein